MSPRLSLWIVPLLFLSAQTTKADELKTLTGKTLTGVLEKITDKEIVLKTETGAVTTPLMQVLDIQLRAGKTAPAAEKYVEIMLIDESVLRCNKVAFGAKEVNMELTSGLTVKVPLDAVATMLRDAQDAAIQKQWAKLSKSKVRSDRIFVLSSGDLNPIDGLLKEISEKDQTVKFKREGGGEVDLKLDRLQGLRFLRTDNPAEAGMCKIIDLDGNSLVAAKLGFDGMQMTIGTTFGSKATIDPKAIARLNFNFGRMTYLSDLDAKVSESPFLGGFSPLRKDANLDGNPIMLMDKQYPKGLSMYAGVELEYKLDGKYKEFKALLGADARIAEEGQGTVVVTIYCDREKRFSEPVTTKAVKNIAVNVKDVGTLRIVVSGANFTNYSGHATLANAYVSQ